MGKISHSHVNWVPPRLLGTWTIVHAPRLFVTPRLFDTLEYSVKVGMVLPKLNSTSSNYQTGRYWQLWSNLPFLIPIPIGNWYSLCSVTASWPTPLEKVWNVSNYKREQRLKSLKIYEFWKSTNFENLRILNILKIKISWKSWKSNYLENLWILKI